MKILMVHNRYRIAGGEDVSTRMQVDLLRSRGHDVVFVEETSDRVSELGYVRVAFRSVWSRDAYRTIDDVLSDGGFDVMHVQNFFPLFSPSVYYAAARHGVPVVQSLRNFRLVCPQGMLFRDGQACDACVGKAAAWPAVRHGCYRGSTAGSIVVASMSTLHGTVGTWRNAVNRYVTPSKSAAAIFVGAGWDPDSITVIPNHVFPDPGPGDGTGDFALYVGRLAPSKGVHTLIEAWEEAGLEVPLKIAGDGQLREMVEGACARIPAIEYLGPLEVEQTIDLMGRASFIIAPTIGTETFGRVVAEAQARGTPAIVSDRGALPEIVEDRVSGRLVPPGDAEALAACVGELWSDGHARSMRDAARMSFERNFSDQVAATRWEELYGDLIKGSPR